MERLQAREHGQELSWPYHRGTSPHEISQHPCGRSPRPHERVSACQRCKQPWAGYPRKRKAQRSLACARLCGSYPRRYHKRLRSPCQARQIRTSARGSERGTRRKRTRLSAGSRISCAEVPRRARSRKGRQGDLENRNELEPPRRLGCGHDARRCRGRVVRQPFRQRASGACGRTGRTSARHRNHRPRRRRRPRNVEKARQRARAYRMRVIRPTRLLGMPSSCGGRIYSRRKQ